MTKIFQTLTLLLTCLFAFTTHAANDRDVPAVLKSNGICTMDFNSCGNASICSCEEGYVYDANVGYCVIENVNDANYPGFDKRSIKSSCSIQVPPQSICTRDINSIGYPSLCDCRGVGEYDERLGQCVLSLN